MNKYIVITRSIAGRLMNVNEFTGKRNTNHYVNEMLEGGYQITVTKWSVFMTAENFDEERRFYGVERLV